MEKDEQDNEAMPKTYRKLLNTNARETKAKIASPAREEKKVVKISSSFVIAFIYRIIYHKSYLSPNPCINTDSACR